MRLDRVLAFIALLAVGLAFGDEPDWTIYVPDSLSGLMYSQCAAYNPVTDKVYVGGTGNCVIVIDCATNTKVARIPTKSDCSAIFCSPVNGKVYCVGDLLTVIDGVSDTVVKTLHASGSAFCYNSRNQRLYAGLGSTSVIDTRTDSMVATIDAGASSLCYNPHDDKVYYKSNGHVEDRNYVMILNGKDLSFIRTVPAKSGPGTLCYNSANNKVYCADYGSKTVMVIDGTTDKVLTTIAADSGLADMCCNPRDNKIYLANGAHAPRGEESDMIGPGWHAHPYHDYGDSTVTVIDGATDKVRTAISTHGRPMLLSYDSASNKVLAATDGGSFGTSLESLLTLPKPGQVLPLHSSGRHVETNRGPGVDIIDGTSNQLTASATLSQHSSAFCFDSQRGYAYCVISDRDHSGAAVLDVATGQVLADPPMGRSPGALCYNSDDDRLYCSIPTDSELMVLDGATNHVVARVAPGRTPGRLIYNPRNDKLYCQVSEANQVLVMNAKTNKVMSTLNIGAPVSYAPQNNRVYSFKDSRAVVVTDGATDSAIAEILVQEPGAICSNPRTNRVYCTGDAGVAVINGITNTLVSTVPVHYARYLCCDPHDNRVYCASWLLDTVTVINGATNTIDTTLHMAARALCYNERDNKLYFGGEQGLLVMDAANYGVSARFPDYQGIETIYHDTKNNGVYCVGGGKVVVLDGATDKMLRAYDIERGSYVLAYNNAQNRVYLANQYGTSISELDGDAVVSGSFGRLDVSSFPPGAAISLDSTSSRRKTPHLFGRIPAGQYSIGLSKMAYPGWDSTVMVNRGQTTAVRATLKSPPESLWISYADSHGERWVNSAGPERAVRIDVRPEFGYPLHIARVSAIFYLWLNNPLPKPWRDSSFRFKIYGGDGRTLLYQSPVLKAVPGEPGPAVIHELTRPITIDSGEFYLSVAPVDTSGTPSNLGMSPYGNWRGPGADSYTHSYAGSPGHWTPLKQDELSLAVLVRR